MCLPAAERHISLVMFGGTDGNCEVETDCCGNLGVESVAEQLESRL